MEVIKHSPRVALNEVTSTGGSSCFIQMDWGKVERMKLKFGKKEERKLWKIVEKS